ncbi:MAG: phage major capsid protein [Actinomycetota bacterium]|nr:phage major capsid protein [Actinomycetota bacterium]
MAITTSANGTLSQDIVERILLAPLAQQSTWLRLGTPEFVSDGNAVRLPSLSSIGTAVGYIAEGSEITEASVATSEVVLLPSTVYSIKTVVKMTRESIETAAINLESAMAQAITTRVSALVDTALWSGGTATTGSPIGLTNMTGFTNAGTAASTAIVSSDLFAMDEKYQLAFADDSRAHWAMSPTTFKRIRLMSDNYGARVLAPALSEGAPSTILGHPYTVTSFVPDTALVLFDKSKIATGRAPASVTVLDQTYADYDIVGIRVTARYDVQPLNAAAIVKLTLT